MNVAPVNCRHARNPATCATCREVAIDRTEAKLAAERRRELIALAGPIAAALAPADGAGRIDNVERKEIASEALSLAEAILDELDEFYEVDP